MDMSVEHISPGIPLFVQLILSVVKHNGIMAEDHLSVIIMKLLIRFDPLKTAPVHVSFQDHMIMISLDQIQLSVKVSQQFISLCFVSPGQISDDHHFVILSDFSVPPLHHGFVHGLYCLKPSAVHMGIKGPMEKVQVRNVISQFSASSGLFSC